MGEKKTKTKAFLEKHPLCCYCGSVATTIDHCPPRIMFLNKEGPEGYEFPSCAGCNNGTSQQEQIAALYLSLTHFEDTPEFKCKLKKIMLGIHNNNRAALPVLKLPANEKIKAVTKYFGFKPKGFSKNLPVCKMPISAEKSVSTFTRKLTCALYYKELGRIIPNDHYIYTQYAGHNDVRIKEASEFFISNLHNPVIPQRNNTEIGFQFIYNWGWIDNEIFAYIAQISNSHFIIGIVDIKTSQQSPNLKIHSDDFNEGGWVK